MYENEKNNIRHLAKTKKHYYKYYIHKYIYILYYVKVYYIFLLKTNKQNKDKKEKTFVGKNLINCVVLLIRKDLNHFHLIIV